MSDQHEPKDLLPRALRLLLGATAVGVSDSRLRHAVAGKLVLITGASRGIGSTIAAALAARGARVSLLGRDAQSLNTVADGGGSRYRPVTGEVDPGGIGTPGIQTLRQLVGAASPVADESGARTRGGRT